MTELINENELSLATYLSIVPLKLLLTVPALSALGLIMCIAEFIDEHKWYCSYKDLGKIYNLPLMRSTDKSSISFDASTEQDLSEYLEELYNQIYPKEEDK